MQLASQPHCMHFARRIREAGFARHWRDCRAAARDGAAGTLKQQTLLACQGQRQTSWPTSPANSSSSVPTSSRAGHQAPAHPSPASSTISVPSSVASPPTVMSMCMLCTTSAACTLLW